MKQYEHAITVHKADEILAMVPDLQAEETPPMVYCDYQGQCFFDESPSPYMKAIIEILNAQGEQGWGLVQIVLREQELICFWRRDR